MDAHDQLEHVRTFSHIIREPLLNELHSWMRGDMERLETICFVAGCEIDWESPQESLEVGLKNLPENVRRRANSLFHVICENKLREHQVCRILEIEPYGKSELPEWVKKEKWLLRNYPLLKEDDELQAHGI